MMEKKQDMAKILVVDDDQLLCEMLTDQLHRKGHDAIFVNTLSDAKKIVFVKEFDVVFLDVQLPDGNGLMELAEIKKAPSAPEVIIMTGKSDPDGAEQAVKSGAWDYLEKPALINEMLLPLSRVLQYRKEKRKVAGRAVALKRQEIVGNSAQLAKCLDQVARISAGNSNVLIIGETGTGKELFAKAVHENSSRAAKNFVVVDCAALPETLVESLLFGHEKGAFTGADKAGIGLIKQADGGTLFLDEIGELSLNIQKKFLRALQEHKFRPVGSSKEVVSDFRLIAATNRDLEKMVQQGEFRADFLFRFQTMCIELPPLKKRRGDIQEISIHHISRLCRRYDMETKGFAPDFFGALNSYNWPGNVRELNNILEVTLNNALREPTLYARHLPEKIRICAVRSSVNKDKSFDSSDNLSDPSIKAAAQPPFDLFRHRELPLFKEYRDEYLQLAEREYLQRLMKDSRGIIKEACRMSGLGRTRLYTLMKKHNISRYGWSS